MSNAALVRKLRNYGNPAVADCFLKIADEQANNSYFSKEKKQDVTFTIRKIILGRTDPSHQTALPLGLGASFSCTRHRTAQ